MPMSYLDYIEKHFDNNTVHGIKMFMSGETQGLSTELQNKFAQLHWEKVHNYIDFDLKKEFETFECKTLQDTCFLHLFLNGSFFNCMENNLYLKDDMIDFLIKLHNHIYELYANLSVRFEEESKSYNAFLWLCKRSTRILSKLEMYTTTYNFLRIMSGCGGLSYSN